MAENLHSYSQPDYMQGADCGNRKHLAGAVVYSHVRSDKQHEHYTHGIECQLTFQTENTGWRLMLRVLDIDIPDMSRRGICNDALYVYDDETIFTRAMKEAGGNGGLCGNNLPPAINSTGEYLTVHFRTDGKGPLGKGFKFIVTAFNEDFKKFNSCGANFQCDNGLCIEKDLVCDRVDHCGDLSDESIDGKAACERVPLEEDGQQGIINKFLSLGVTASVAITVGSVVVVIVVVVAVVCCCRRSSCRKARDTHTGVTTTPTTVVSNGNSVPYQPPPSGVAGFPPSFSHHGYYPMQPVFPANQGPVYLPFSQRESYSHPSAYSSQPPSYHRSYTPTSSKSGKSNRSNTSVTYSQSTDKVILPVNL
ncbi:abnormal cell migration protein 13-like [Liolophura sinensis]|uniref:abnormal cell migration protein 13-like n=1 Tax=Liolophura sinensis TaxID=3198878 RepID=UPI003158DF36